MNKGCGGREQGSITVFFVLLTAVLVGVTAYSLYIGRMVDRKMKVETTADTASLAMANHAAMGMNMMAANNLAIAGNLHVAAAVPMIGRYYALIRALAADEADAYDAARLVNGDDLTLGFDPDGTPFAKAFDWIKPGAAFFTKTAGGLTTVNRKLATLWLKGGFIKGVEQIRLNSPGAIGVPLQVANLQGGMGGAASFYNFRYRNLAQTAMQPTMCHTIESSEVIGEKRNSVVFWLTGPLTSLDGELGNIFGPLAAIEAGVHTVVDVVNGLLEGAGVVLAPALIACKLAPPGVHVPLCPEAEAWGDAMANGNLIPVPTFGGCGLKLSGDYGSQMQAFSSSGAASPMEIGFLFPGTAAGSTADWLTDFEQSLQFAALVGTAQYSDAELPSATVGGIKVATCPDGWTSSSAGGRPTCAVALGDLGARAQGSSWARTQWALAQAKAEYEPDDATDDPMSADSLHIPPDQRESVANARRFQLFWPAWRGRNMEATVASTAFAILGLK